MKLSSSVIGWIQLWCCFSWSYHVTEWGSELMLVEILINRRKTNVDTTVIRLFSVWLADEGRVGRCEIWKRMIVALQLIKRDSRGVWKRELFFCESFFRRFRKLSIRPLLTINCSKTFCTNNRPFISSKFFRNIFPLMSISFFIFNKNVENLYSVIFQLFA